MGNKHSGAGKIHRGAPELAASKFNKDELWVLKQTWQDMAERNDGRGIDKDTFLQYFPLNGLLGERMFESFDKKKTGYIDLDDFVVALAVMARGNLDQKTQFLFDMCDVYKEGTVSKAELETFVNQVPCEILHNHNVNGSHMHDGDAKSSSRGDSPVPEGEEANRGDDDEDGDNVDSDEEYEEEVDAYTNHDIVVQAFHDCDVENDGRLTFEEFKMWVERTPAVIEYIESIVPYSGGSKNPKGTPHDRRETLPLSYQASKGLQGGLSKVASDGSLSAYDNESERLSMKIDHEVTADEPSTFHKLVRQNSRGRSSTAGSSTFNTTPPSPGGKYLSPAGSGSSVPGSGGGSGTGSRLSSSDSNAGSVEAALSPTGQLLKLTRQKDVAHSIEVSQEFYSGKNIPDLNEDKSNSELVAMMHLEAAMGATQSKDVKMAMKELIEYMTHHHYRDHVDELTPKDQESRTPRQDDVISHQGYLLKKGSHLHLWSKRYYVVSGSCVYYYSSEKDVRPKHVIFLTGSVIEKIKDVQLETKGYYGFEVTHMNIVNGDHHKHDTRVLYTRSEEERDEWVAVLQQAAHVVPITDHYVIAAELGRGRFSVVHECVNKRTGEHLAVKIIDKNTVKPEEKTLLRTEIAVLKLMHHPHIIRMDGLYETKEKVYIVMEMLKGGELFERIVGRPRFTESDTAKLLRPLLESVAYMHDLGIVHRDIKPENILCGENLDDVKIADFGLSKMIMPNEKMVQACGTLSYVAPEVLTNQGYGKEADMWSVGVIMFLLLCGKLPFDGEDSYDIIKSTIQGDLKVNPSVWNKLSDQAKSLLTSLLNKSCHDRITARAALKHPFLQLFYPEQGRRRKSVHHREASSSRASTTTSSATAAAAAAAAAPATGSGSGSGSGSASGDNGTPAPALSAK